MDPTLQENFNQLRTPLVERKFLSAMFGIAWPPNDSFVSDLRIWAKNSPIADGEKVNRHLLEAFLQSQRLSTAKFEALALGMTEQSFRHLLEKLPEIGLRKQYEVYPGIIDTSLKDDLVRALPQLRYRSFVTHDSFCERLHQAITEELGIGVEKQPCATSVELSEEPILYAGTIDSLTLRPLSIKHQVWLDFGKPLNLPPDSCSKLTLAENLAELQQFVAGHTTPNLDLYETVARRGQ